MLTGRVTNAIESVKNSPASIFTKEDVIKLLATTMDETIPTVVNDETEVEPTITLTLSQFEAMKEEIENALSDFTVDVNPSDVSDVTFSFEGDRVVIDDISVDVDTFELHGDIVTLLEEYINFDLAK